MYVVNNSIMFVLVMVFVFTRCIAVNIQHLKVPSVVQVGIEAVILDCEYTGAMISTDGLVVKWFFNGPSGLVYQWIPPLKPQVVGLLKGKVDMDFRISDSPLQAYRAMKIVRPSTDLSGNYTCVVSTFLEEDRQTKSMLVFSPGKGVQFFQEKKYVFLVTLICIAQELYPRPEMNIFCRGEPLKQAISEVKMNAWGLYTVKTTAVVHDDDVTPPWGEFVCMLRLPPADYSVNRTTVYYTGLMPTAYIAAVGMEKHQERQTNGGHQTSTYFFIYLLVFSSKFIADW